MLVATSSAAEGDLSPGEVSQLEQGLTIVRPQSLERGGRHYVGGMAYAVVDASAEDLESLLGDPQIWKRILPKTRAARRVGAIGDDTLIELTQGNALIQGTYTIRLHREDHGARFWVDPQRGHDIEDGWGFLRLEPTPEGHTLVTYGVLVDLGPGLIRNLFEDTIRRLALSVPDRVRGFVQQRRAPGR
jgi:hypothetical protein